MSGELIKLKIKAFKDYDNGTGADLYNLAYARSFGVKVEDIPKGGRQIGKVQELGLGYQGGVSAFLTFAAVYKMDLDAMAEAVWASAPQEALDAATGMLSWVKKKKRSTFGLSDRTYIACEVLKAAWRAAHPATEAFWHDMESAVRSAIGHPGEAFRVRQLVVRKDGTWMRIRLPSGRYLCYLNPEVDQGGQISYMGVNQYSRKWTRLKSYGGKFFENVCQAVARDDTRVYDVAWLQMAFGRPLTHMRSGVGLPRLFPMRELIRFDGVVHEGPQLHHPDTPHTTFNTKLAHHSRRTVHQSLLKLAQYAQLGAVKRAAVGKRGGVLRGMASGLASFVRLYVFHRGFLCGSAGFLHCFLVALESFFRYAALAVDGDHLKKAASR